MDKAKRLVYLKHMTHEAMMLDKINKQTKLVHDLAVQVRDGTLGKPDKAKPAFEEDEMGVAVGNEVHNHYNYSQPILPQAKDEEPALATAERLGGLRRFIIPALVGASLPLAGVLGLGIFDSITNKPVSPASPQRAYGIDLEVKNPQRRSNQERSLLLRPIEPAPTVAPPPYL